MLKEVVELFPPLCVVKIETEIDPIALPSKILSPIGIILTELVTNTMKYAFPDQREGLIRFKATQKDNHVSLIFEDNGIGLPESYAIESSPGFGMQLVRMLVQQIWGTITIDGKHGTRFCIEFDVDKG